MSMRVSLTLVGHADYADLIRRLDGLTISNLYIDSDNANTIGKKYSESPIIAKSKPLAIRCASRNEMRGKIIFDAKEVAKNYGYSIATVYKIFKMSDCPVFVFDKVAYKNSKRYVEKQEFEDFLLRHEDISDFSNI